MNDKSILKHYEDIALIYVSLAFWLLMTIFAGAGTYRLWSRLAHPAWVNWALLPGTVVSEMAYIFGCLITGGEIRRARLIEMPTKATRRKGESDSDQAGTQANPRLKVIGSIVPPLVAMVVCGWAIVVVHWLLGDPVIDKFTASGGMLVDVALPKQLPTGWVAFWDQLAGQITLLRRICETWGRLNWLDWRVWVFVYLSICLSVKLTPARRPMRMTLAAAVIIVAVIAIFAPLSGILTALIGDVWPLLTYVWTSLLFLLAITLIVHGLVALAGIVAGKGDKVR